MTSSLQDLLDAFLNGDSPPEAFLSELSAYCNATPDSSWEVLALLDQYHRRGKLSGDSFRALRRKVEFRALGITDTGNVEPLREPIAVDANADEVLRLRTALAGEREKSRRYKHRIATLAAYGRRTRNSSRSRLLSAPAKARPGRALVAAWLAQHRRLQHPRTWSYAAVLLATVTVIAGSSSNLGQFSNAPGAATTPVILEAAPQLPAAILEPQTISLSSAKFFVMPGSSMATIQVDRTGELGDVARFKWWTHSAGAKSGEDYVGKSQIAQFEAGEASIQLPVRILANPQRTHTEMFYVAIGEPDEGSLGPNSRAAVFIMRKD